MTGWRDEAATYAAYRVLVESEVHAAYAEGVPMNRRRAGRLVSREVARAKKGRPGIVKPAGCEKCGLVVAAPQLHGHHTDYARPLHVYWLCTWCHRAVHLGEPLGIDRPPVEPTRPYATGSATGRTNRERTAPGRVSVRRCAPR